MYPSWESLTHLQTFFQLGFLFSGLEVSSFAVFAARLLVLILFGAGILWGLLKIVLKSLDCIQAFLGNLNRLPWTFFLLILLAFPLSRESLGAQWTGYILGVAALLAVAAVSVFMVVLWKYGLDQALRFVGSLRSRSRRAEGETVEFADPSEQATNPREIIPEMGASEGSRSWSRL
jgi:hypothetical protein